MSGGASEYVMGNASSMDENYTFNPSSSGFTNSWYTNITEKYFTTYAYGSNDSDIGQTDYNRSRLGDATGEVVLNAENNNGGWYSDYTDFPVVGYPWIERGCYSYNSFGAGIFCFGRIHGDSYNNISSRSVLVSFSSY